MRSHFETDELYCSSVQDTITAVNGCSYMANQLGKPVFLNKNLELEYLPSELTIETFHPEPKPTQKEPEQIHEKISMMTHARDKRLVPERYR